jgi:hypothetical protein
MALSNIFKEPRREITETVVGLAVAVPFATADCYLFGLNLGAFLGAMVGGAVFIHEAGESLCDYLQEAGIHLRPRQRR